MPIAIQIQKVTVRLVTSRAPPSETRYFAP